MDFIRQYIYNFWLFRDSIERFNRKMGLWLHTK